MHECPPEFDRAVVFPFFAVGEKGLVFLIFKLTGESRMMSPRDKTENGGRTFACPQNIDALLLHILKVGQDLVHVGRS